MPYQIYIPHEVLQAIDLNSVSVLIKGIDAATKVKDIAFYSVGSLDVTFGDGQNWIAGRLTYKISDKGVECPNLDAEIQSLFDAWNEDHG